MAKRITYPQVYLTEEVKYLFSENCKTLKQETEEDTNKWKDIACSLIRKINNIKMSILTHGIYRFDASLSKYQWHCPQNRNIILKYTWDHKRL